MVSNEWYEDARYFGGSLTKEAVADQGEIMPGCLYNFGEQLNASSAEEAPAGTQEWRLAISRSTLCGSKLSYGRANPILGTLVRFSLARHVPIPLIGLPSAFVSAVQQYSATTVRRTRRRS
jgi:hypothetical protein